MMFTNECILESLKNKKKLDGGIYHSLDVFGKEEKIWTAGRNRYDGIGLERRS